jgi:rubrerythrin
MQIQKGAFMTIGLGEAIQTAIEFEKKVHKVYADAAGKIADPVGKRTFLQLAVEEAGHLAYLESRLGEWRKKGHIDIVELSTVVPDRKRIAEGQKRLARSMKRRETATMELEFLKQAFEAEKETSSFYQRMVAELPDEGRNLFARFVAIEEGHAAIVQAEIDSVQGMGFWFDMQEFNLEAG